MKDYPQLYRLTKPFKWKGDTFPAGTIIMMLPDEYADELEYIDITHEMATMGAEIRTVYFTSLSNKFWHIINGLIGRAPCITPSPQSDYDLWEGYTNVAYAFLKKVD